MLIAENFQVPTDSSAKRKVAQAVRQLKLRVTASDVVAKTGLSFEAVSSALNQLASETLATLDVSNTGEIYYKFPTSFALAQLTTGLRSALEALRERALPVFNTIFKLFFGLSLLLSVVFISIALLMIYSICSVFLGTYESVSQLWREWFEFFGSVAAQLIRQNSGPGERNAPGKAFGAIAEACFSLLFGEPNPNVHIEQERSQLIAQMIRLNEGVILPEHLCPYTARESGDQQTIFKVLANFQGYPIVSQGGEILLYFPGLRGRNLGRNINTEGSDALMPEHLLEQPWSFSNLTPEQNHTVIALAMFNVSGSLLLFFLSSLAAHRQSGSVLFFLALGTYNSLFFIIPAIRYVVLRVINSEIAQRNAIVEKYDALLGHPNPETILRLQDVETSRLALEAPLEQVVYTTADDYLSQMTTGEWLHGER